jgi:hypothetical protein
MPSESSKWIAIVLSLAAITISGLSWWESHRGRVINEEINRPVLDYSNGDLGVTPFGDQIRVSVMVSLKNTGKSTAILNNVKIDGRLITLTPNCRFSDARPFDETYPDEILPGTDGAFLNDVAYSSKCRESSEGFLLELSVNYADPVSGKVYFQKFVKHLQEERPAPQKTGTPR